MPKHSIHQGTEGKESTSGSEKEKMQENQAEPSQIGNVPGGEAVNLEEGKPDPAVDQAAGDKEKSPEEKIAELEAKLAEANDQYLRKAADFENFRKRMNREKQEAIEYANQSLLLDLIQTMDDFERALKSAESITTGEFSISAVRPFYEGISMIEKRLSSQLENKWGLKRFNSAGEPFDPNCHEAVQMDKSAEISEPTVLEEYFKGYTLKDRVIRSAKVKVLMPEKSENGAADGRDKETHSSGDSG
jgi:molecular chaperone GrpE